MVQRDQFLERSVVVKSGDLSLDALYHRGRRAPPCVIACPHPALGGSMTVPVINELAWTLTRTGFPTLRFDYRGVGASQGKSRHAAGAEQIGDISDELQDLRSAIDQLIQSTRRDAVCVVGYSFGAILALAVAGDAQVERIVLIAPPTAAADFAPLERVRKPVLVVCAQDDDRCDRARLRIPPAGQLEVIAHADHSFRRGLPELGKAVAAWVASGSARADPAPAGAAPDTAQPEEFRDVDLPESPEPPLELDDG
jgi:alpha/beta superfamily hydrolase